MPSDPKNPAKPSAGAPAGKAADPRPSDPRQERLARALRDNLKKRKAQQRRRQEEERPGEGREEDPGAGPGGSRGGES